MSSNKRRMIALAVDASMDASLGIIAAWLAALLCSRSLSLWMVLIGIVSAYGPDADAVWFAFKNKFRSSRDLYRHRSGLHYPIPYLAVQGLLLWQLAIRFVPEYTALLVCICSVGAFLHLAHDTVIHGFGIAWLYVPGLDKIWSYCRRRIVLFARTNAAHPVPWIFTFSMESIKVIRETYRDPQWYELFFQFPPHPWVCILALTHVIGIIIVLFSVCTVFA